MLIATFGPTTAWAGKTITREGDTFILEGHGRITAADVMEYDRQGQPVWVNDGTRAWVGSRAPFTPDGRIESSRALPVAQALETKAIRANQFDNQSGQEEFFVPLSGAGSMLIDGEAIPLRPGRYVLVQPRRPRRGHGRLMGGR